MHGNHHDVHLAWQQGDAASVHELQVAKNHVVHGDQAGGGHDRAPVAVVKQEGQQCEDTEMALHSALGLLDGQRRKDHQRAGNRQPGSQRAGCHFVDGRRYQPSRHAHQQGQSDAVCHPAHAKTDRQQKDHHAQHDAVCRRALRLKNLVCVP